MNMNPIRIYSVSDLSKPPTPVKRAGLYGFEYSQELRYPPPLQLIFFTLGDWCGLSNGSQIKVHLNIGEKAYSLGTITNKSRCLFWQRRKDCRLDEVKIWADHNTPVTATAILSGQVLSNECPSQLPIDMDVQTHVSELTSLHESQMNVTNSSMKVRRSSAKRLSSSKMHIEADSDAKKLRNKTRRRSRMSKRGLDDITNILGNENKENIDVSLIMKSCEEAVRTLEKHGLRSGSIREMTDNDQSNVNVTDRLNTAPVADNDDDDDDASVTPVKIAPCKDITCRVGPMPTSRWGHSLCLTTDMKAVLIGGQGEKQQLSRDSVWTVSTDTRKWTSCDTSFEGTLRPELRMGHTSTYDALVQCVYVYGGSKNLKWFREVHVLDLNDWKWTLVKTNGKAPPRAYHTTTLFCHELWIIGGVYPRPDPQPDGCSNDVHIFSPVLDSWYMPKITGNKPLPRSGHSATLIGDQLVVFGGWDAPICYNDLFILDLCSLEWNQPVVNGTPPKHRSWHAACALSGERVLIHGGYDGNLALPDTHVFNMGTSTWTEIYMDPLPSARAGHVILCLPYKHDNQQDDELLIFGGGDNDGEFYREMYSLYVPIE